MPVAELASEIDFDGWRKAARAFRLAGVEPGEARFVVAGAGGTGSLFDTPSVHPGEGRGARNDEFSVPRAFVDIAQEVILHRSEDRFDLMYRLLWRLRNEPHLMKVVTDPHVADALERVRNVSRASHKMKAFVRFRVLEEAGVETFVAWFEPAHRVLEKTAPFFMRRFTTMRWSILTPDGSCFWDGETMSLGPPADAADAPTEDAVEEFWKTYYASIFNPARVKVGAMLKEMPRKYWKNMPETALVPDLLATAQKRESGMIEKARTMPGNNSEAAWQALREEALSCTRCHLYKHATQTVFGEGPLDASIMFVGEQPGDQEDLAGHPFVGPAGQLFDRALAEAGIDRAQTYVTNAVKHFKFEPRGKRRIHAKPDAGEIEACRWWIEQEQALLRPKVTVALGATAARSLFGKVMTISRERGRPLRLPSDGGDAWITVHPSYLLRLPDEAARSSEYARFVEDLRRIGETAA